MNCIIEQVASQPPYNIKVTEAEINQGLRDEANLYYYGTTSSTTTTTTTTTTPTATTTATPAGTTTTTTTTTTPVQTLTDAEYNEWYRQQLNQSQLSESQFRDLEKVTLIEDTSNTISPD